MGLLYGIVGIIIVTLMLSLPILPFYKVWKRLKIHHRDLWNGMGPFDFISLVTDSGTQASFLRIIKQADKQEKLAERDPELIKWTNVCKELLKNLPRGFAKQIFIALILLFIASAFTNAIDSLIT